MRVVVVVVALAGVEVIRVKDKGRNGLTVNVDTECNRMSGERGRVQRKKGVCGRSCRTTPAMWFLGTPNNANNIFCNNVTSC